MNTDKTHATHVIVKTSIRMIMAEINQIPNEPIRETLLAMLCTGCRYSGVLQFTTKAKWSVNRHRMKGIVPALVTGLRR
jgi:hypothetical protein